MELLYIIPELKRQYIMVKNTIPLCLHKNDSVKNKLIIRNAKAKCRKSFDLNEFLTFTINIINNSIKPKIPKSAKF